MIDDLANDTVAALRTIRRRPAAYLGAFALLTLGVGAVTLVFSLVRGVLLESLPFAEPERLVSIWERSDEPGALTEEAPRRAKNVVSPANFLDWREQSETVEKMAAFAVTAANLTEVGDPRRVRLGLVTEGYFETLGIEPEVGRLFAPEEMVADSGHPTTVLSHALWRTVFGEDPAVLGRRVQVDGRDLEVIGVMPPGVELDMGEAAGTLGAPADLWTPLPITEQWSQRRGRWLLVVGRLGPGVSVDSASAELDTIAERLAVEYPAFNEGWGVTVSGLHDHVTSTVRPTLLLLLGAVLLVLVIVCANATSLLLTRAAERSNEMRVRGALG
ncbi:MAG TPA: ABC transporter permease, partial [Thermoanaerobaculia bacterium]|nr:ABC transporter permease [Thermoanaerobaculia bacterium]